MGTAEDAPRPCGRGWRACKGFPETPVRLPGRPASGQGPAQLRAPGDGGQQGAGAARTGGPCGESARGAVRPGTGRAARGVGRARYPQVSLADLPERGDFGGGRGADNRPFRTAALCRLGPGSGGGDPSRRRATVRHDGRELRKLQPASPRDRQRRADRLHRRLPLTFGPDRDPTPGRGASGERAVLSLGRHRPLGAADISPHRGPARPFIEAAPDGPKRRGGRRARSWQRAADAAAGGER